MSKPKYQGPAKPIKLDPEQWSPWEKIERIVFLLCLLVLAYDLFVGRPG